MEQKNDDKIEKMRKEVDYKLEAILREVKSNKTTSTNPRSDVNEILDSQHSGSKTNRSIGVRASNIENSDSENESDVDVTILSNEESDVEDCHSLFVVNASFYKYLDLFAVDISNSRADFNQSFQNYPTGSQSLKHEWKAQKS